MAAVKGRDEAAHSTSLSVVDGRIVGRAEKSHQEGQKQRLVLAENNPVITMRIWLKHWTFQHFYGIINTVKSD